MTALSINTEKSKRTRTNVKQSKYGCFTCKARRIKCDEAKPACRRCLTAKRECPGYPRGAPPGPSPDTASPLPLLSLSSSSSSSPSPLRSLSSSAPPSFILNPTYPSSPFVDLACSVLAQSPRRGRTDLELAFWSRIVPQLTHSIPSVRAAVEAFGASYKEYVLRISPTLPGLETAKRYTQALRLAQEELATLKHGPIPCIIACLFLACVEALQQRLDKGHLHLLGAFSLMTPETKKLLTDVDIEDVSFLLQKLDLHIATYAVSQPPSLPAVSITKDVLISDPPDRALFKILHSCYHFTAKAQPYKYASRRLVPPELLIEQGRQLSNLKQWLSSNELPPSWDVDSRIEDESLLVQRAQCLAAVVHTATILEPRETAYDCYGPDFEEIITLIETLSRDKDTENLSNHDEPSPLPSFIPEMGIVQPLYWTALKYRNSFWRRKALKILLTSGKEGPWCGETEGSLVATVIRIEEGLLEKPSPNMARLEDTTTDSASNIPEKNRVNACWTIDPEEEKREANPTTEKRFTKAIIYRCIDIEGIIREEQEPREFPWEDPKHWETWFESLEAIN